MIGTMSKPLKTFVGFGFGPIQAGLFLYEAQTSKHFSRFVVAEIDPALVRAVRENGGECTVNIARKDGIDRFTLKGVEIYNPRDPAAWSGPYDRLRRLLPSV